MDLGEFDINGMMAQPSSKPGSALKTAPYQQQWARANTNKIHAVASDPLPEGAKWRVKIEKPDGVKSVGWLPLLNDIDVN